jgi:type I restriction enzyme S subunit
MNQPLPSYPDYKSAGLPWLEQIPEHWEKVRLKKLFVEIDRRSGTGKEPLLSLSKSRGLIRQSELTDKLFSVADLSNYKIVEPGQIVMNRMQAWNGMFAQATETGLVSPDYAVLKSVTDASVPFLLHLLKSPLIVARFVGESKGLGTGFNRLYTDRFGAIYAQLPPFKEQQRIVAFLEAKGRQIAKLLRAKRQLIKLLQEQKQALVQRVVSQGLNSEAPRKDSGIAWLGDIPAHWEVKRLKTLMQNVVQQTLSMQEDDTYIALENIESWTGKLYFTSKEVIFESQVKRYSQNDILFGKLRPYLAKVVRPSFKGVCVGELLVLRALNNSPLTAAFAEYKLRSKTLISLITSSTFGAKMPRADWEFIGNIPFAFPPDETEQHSIVTHIESESYLIDETIDRAQREIELIQEYRTRLVADVVTGRIDVRQLTVAATAPLQDEDDLLDEEEVDEDELIEETLETDG